MFYNICFLPFALIKQLNRLGFLSSYIVEVVGRILYKKKNIDILKKDKITKYFTLPFNTLKGIVK